MIVLLTGLAMAAALVASEPDRSRDTDAAGARASSSAEAGTPGATKGRGASNDRRESGEAGETSGPLAGKPNAPSGANSDRLIVIGQLEDQRLIAIAPEVALREAKSTPKAGITTHGRSDPVGGPYSLLPHGSELLVLATDHKQLVRLERDWRVRHVLDIAPSLNAAGKGALNFGPILRISEREIVFPVAFASSIGLVKVDVEAWRVTQAREITDRFAGFPAACLTHDGVIVSSTNYVDRYSLVTFDREQTTPFKAFASGLACTKGGVWAASIESSTGRVLDPVTLAEKGRFGWQGSGARSLLALDGRVVGTDPVAGIVFACREDKLTCTQSAKLGVRATDVLVDGDVMYVTLEGTRGLALLDSETLDLHGVLPLPDRPRALAILQL